MAKMIVVEECISCGACEPECPNTAISSDTGSYVIDAAKCQECEGAYETPRCIDVCPVAETCILPA